MPTLMAVNQFCNWCAKKPDTPLSCPCHQVWYCNKQCQLAAWKDEHRLQCPNASSIKPDAKFKNGDIVQIHGLRSKVGQHMNGLLAEVQSFDKEANRYAVLLTVDTFTVKSVSLKKENLESHTRVHEAAINAAANVPRSSTPLRIDPDEIQKYRNKAKKLKRMSGKEIVRGLEEDDFTLLSALQLPPSMGGNYSLSWSQTKDMLQNGLVESTLSRFEYPLHLDDIPDDADEPASKNRQHFSYVMILANLLSRGSSPQEEQFLSQIRVDICTKLAPLIMLCANKKRRFQGKTEFWWNHQMSFAVLLANCMLTEAGALVLMHQMDSYVTSTLINHVIFLYTSNPNLYLDQESLMVTQPNPIINIKRFKMIMQPVLMELSDRKNVGDNAVARIANLKIPAGVKDIAGQPFGKCLLRCCAKAALEEYENGPRSGLGECRDEVQYIYSSFHGCSSIRYMLGDFDYELAQRVVTPAQFRSWANKAIKRPLP